MTSISGNRVRVLPPPVFGLQAICKSEVERLNDLPYISIRFNPVGKEPFQLQANVVSGRAITQWRTDALFGFTSKPKSVQDRMTIRFVTSGTSKRRNHKSEFLCEAGQATCVAFEDMVEQEASPSFHALAAWVDRAALVAWHTALEGTDEQPLPQWQPVVDVVSAPMRAFRHNFELVYNRLQSGHADDMTVNLLEELIMYQFLTAWPRMPHQDKKAVAVRPSWQVRRAMDYIEANLHRKIALSDVAATANCGVRSLQLSFRKEVGKTPVQWMLERRLQKVRDDLISESCRGEDIASIARRWGFIHMSDFSRRYRHFFGLSPSQMRADS
ncbi:helix-turn-helix domain-containing protein [Rhizobium sp. SL86]|uniref:helix-turn-helix domain-containing protein n=1 Tax=Rhizobium sp. SL86 TaxID=2995148 RepID=UPI002275A132|nr:AraC family transcriptional regulator [Rhizobium sp. SL86]MCY1667838.1 AraC family transcriptional regulator [Rhizobium sp. SL86]